MSIVSNRDACFTLRFQRALPKAMEIQMNFSIAFHHQSDGQFERVIQILKDISWACNITFGGNWDNNLPLVEFAYNNSF